MYVSIGGEMFPKLVWPECDLACFWCGQHMRNFLYKGGCSYTTPTSQKISISLWVLHEKNRPKSSITTPTILRKLRSWWPVMIIRQNVGVARTKLVWRQPYQPFYVLHPCTSAYQHFMLRLLDNQVLAQAFCGA